MYPTLFTIFGFEISTFGLMVALGFLAGGWLVERYFKEADLDPEAAWRIVIYCAVGGILGSKLWFAAEMVFRGYPESFFTYAFTRRGGMTFYGGLIGGIVAALVAIRIVKVPIAAVFNGAGPTMALGQSLGRMGCFLVGDCYGRVTDSWVGIAFPQGLPPTNVPVHPTQLYECTWLALSAALLWSRRRSSPFLFGEYLLLQGLGRFWIEFFRVNPPLLGPLSQAQLVALGAVVAGIGGWLFIRSRPELQFRTLPRT